MEVNNPGALSRTAIIWHVRRLPCVNSWIFSAFMEFRGLISGFHRLSRAFLALSWTSVNIHDTIIAFHVVFMDPFLVFIERQRAFYRRSSPNFLDLHGRSRSFVALYSTAISNVVQKLDSDALSIPDYGALSWTFMNVRGCLRALSWRERNIEIVP